jgi:hypothetical protein
MPAALLDHSELVTILPGSWTVVATNSPNWLSGERVDPVLSYSLIRESPLTLKSVIAFTDTDGVARTIAGKDRQRGNGFSWRGAGTLRLRSSKWFVAGSDETASILTLRFEKTFTMPGSVEVVVRDGVNVDDARTVVATAADQFGLSVEDFASLSWLHKP